MKDEPKKKFIVFISTPLERQHVERIRDVDPDRLEVIAEPELWPPIRYTADHTGPPHHKRTPEQELLWQQHLAKADILFDFPPTSPDGKGGVNDAPNVCWIQSTSSGVGRRVDDLGLGDSDLIITTAKGVHANSLAEFVFMGLLTHIRGFSFLKKEQKDHRWERYCGQSLEGKTLAIIGVGSVGRQVAKIGAAFDMEVIGSTLTHNPENADQLELKHYYPLNRLHDMLKRADALVISAPDTPLTRHMINREAIGVLKTGAVIINIGRGSIIDEKEMIAALRSGKIGAAILDVFATEPLPPESPLWDMPNVLVSPHSASTVETENSKITDLFCYNLRCFLDGRLADMKNILDKKRMY